MPDGTALRAGRGCRGAWGARRAARRPTLWRLLLGQVVAGLRQFVRNPMSSFFSLAFPLMFLVIFNLLNSGATVPAATGAGGIAFAQFFTPGIATFGIIAACFTNLAINTATARDLGILKRVRGTPLPPSVFLAGRIVSSMLMALLSVALMTAVGVAAYGVEIVWATLVGTVVTVLVGAACFCALGLASTALVANADAAPAVTNILVFPLMFISGIFFPLEGVAAWVRDLASFFPIQHLAAALQAGFTPGTPGPGLFWEDLAVLGAWGLAGLLLAARFFRWEPVPDTGRRRPQRPRGAPPPPA